MAVTVIVMYPDDDDDLDDDVEEEGKAVATPTLIVVEKLVGEEVGTVEDFADVVDTGLLILTVVE